MTVPLRPMTAALLDAEDRGSAAFCRVLDCPEPEIWLPEFQTPNLRASMCQMLTDHASDPGFGGRYIQANGIPVGTCGFKGPPDIEGMVESGYSVIPPARR
jgi:[ribosomal protein S5]-alanine N-acetyltransferase